MSDFGAAKLKEARQARIAEITGVKAKTVQTETAKDTRAENIATNTFYKIVLDPALSPEDKQKAVAKTLATVGTKEENKATIKALDEFKEFLQLKREQMAGNIIDVTNTNTTAQLQQVYTTMNDGLIEFNEAMEPILGIINAMHVVRKEGKTNEIFSDIRNDRSVETEYNLKVENIKQRFTSTQQLIDELTNENARLSEDKALFGLLGIRQSSREKIALNEISIIQAKDNLIRLEQELTTVSAQAPVSVADDSEFGKAKATIRAMLDLSAEEHQRNSANTVEKAKKFVEVSKSALGGIRGSLSGMGEQIDNLTDANQSMISAYAILGEGIKEAGSEIKTKRETLATPAEEESMITKMKRDNELRDIDDHLTVLSSSAVDTETTFADLSSQSVRIKTMADANSSQVEKVRKMHTQGVAGVADRLSVVLQAVGQAAIAESSAIARDTMVQMSDATNEIAMKESMRVALATGDVNDELVKAMEDLGAYGEVVQKATEITRENVAELEQNLVAIREIASSVQDAVKDNAAVHSSIKVEKPEEPKPAENASFKI
jgi:hypothetical protein